jgi:hypothetical protein
MEEGWDKLNVERTIQLAQGNLKLKPLPAEAPGVPKPAKKVAAKAPAARPVVKQKAPIKRGVKRR